MARSLTISNVLFRGFVNDDYFIQLSGFDEIYMSDLIFGFGVYPPVLSNSFLVKISEIHGTVQFDEILVTGIPTPFLSVNNITQLKIINSHFEELGNLGPYIMHLEDLGSVEFVNNTIKLLGRWGTFLTIKKASNLSIFDSSFENIKLQTLSLNRCSDIYIENTTFQKAEFPLSVHD